jgi:hypothetical protein
VHHAGVRHTQADEAVAELAKVMFEMPQGALNRRSAAPIVVFWAIGRLGEQTDKRNSPHRAQSSAVACRSFGMIHYD